MQHFFADPSCVDGEQIRLAGSDVNHMKNVLRMKPGEEVWVSDGEGMDYFCSVEGYEEKEAVLRVVKKRSVSGRTGFPSDLIPGTSERG